MAHDAALIKLIALLTDTAYGFVKNFMEQKIIFHIFSEISVFVFGFSDPSSDGSISARFDAYNLIQSLSAVSDQLHTTSRVSHKAKYQMFSAEKRHEWKNENVFGVLRQMGMSNSYNDVSAREMRPDSLR